MAASVKDPFNTEAGAGLETDLDLTSGLESLLDHVTGNTFQQQPQPVISTRNDPGTGNNTQPNVVETMKMHNIQEAQKMEAPTDKLQSGQATGHGDQSPTDIKREAGAKVDVAQKAQVEVAAMKDAVKQAAEPQADSGKAGGPNLVGDTVSGAVLTAAAAHISPELGTAVAIGTTAKQALDTTKSMMADNAAGKGSMVTGPANAPSSLDRLPRSKGERARPREGYETSSAAPESRTNIMDGFSAKLSQGPGFGPAVPKIDSGDVQTAEDSLRGVTGIGGQDPKAYDQWIAKFENQKHDGELALVAQKVREDQGLQATEGNASQALKMGLNKNPGEAFDAHVM